MVGSLFSGTFLYTTISLVIGNLFTIGFYYVKLSTYEVTIARKDVSIARLESKLALVEAEADKVMEVNRVRTEEAIKDYNMTMRSLTPIINNNMKEDSSEISKLPDNTNTNYEWL